MTTTPQTIMINATTTYSLCTSLSRPSITTASEAQTVVIPDLSCASLLRSGAGTSTIHWNTGSQSNYTFTNTVVITPETATLTRLGTITSGTFTRDRVTRVVQFLNNDLNDACTSPGGLTNFAGPATLTLTGLL